MIPDLHRSFLRTALDRLGADARLVGVAAGGSYLTGSLDEFSDLDLVIAVAPEAYETVLSERKVIAQDLGPLLAAFTGEHVGEPRLLICLYGPPLLHVDLKFISLADVADRVEDPDVLWEREGLLTAVLKSGTARFPQPDLQWIEDRFWVWVHYGACRIGRGELFEAVDFLSFLRERVLGPLALRSRAARPSGVRKLELAAPDLARELEPTVGGYGARSCIAALRASVEVYRKLRGVLSDDRLIFRENAETASMEYLQEIADRCRPS